MNFKDFYELVIKNRSCRRFDNSYKISHEVLKSLVDLARNCASASNKQPLKYIVSRDDNTNALIFSCLGWAGYLKDWKGPDKNERPSAYIIIMGDYNISNNFWCDHGIAAQTILLGARSIALGGCIFGVINTKKLKQHLNIKDNLQIKLVIALGKPIEKIKLEKIDKNKSEKESIKYWRDENQIHYVPKRELEDIIIDSF